MTVHRNSKLYTDFHSYYYYETQFLLCPGTGSGKNAETTTYVVLGINIEPFELY